jgi:aspartyl/asparaginyl-tRNA synthetase
MITLIKHAPSASTEGDIEIAGWIRSRRDAKTFSFLEVNDGSCLRNLQVIVDQEVPGYEQMMHATTGSSVRVAAQAPGAQLTVTAVTLTSTWRSWRITGIATSP